MALKDFMAGRGEATDQQQAAPPPPRPAAPASRPARTVGPSTCIDASTDLKGTLRCRETLRIDGRVEGEIKCEKNIIVGEGAKIQAAIEAAEVAVGGDVRGDITASRKITLEATARVVGNLSTPGIVIEEGAKLEGRIVIGAEAEAEEKAAARPAETAKAPAAQKPAAKTPPPPSASV